MGSTDMSKSVKSGVRCGNCSTRESVVFHEAAKDVARCYYVRYQKAGQFGNQLKSFDAIAEKRGWKAA